MHIKKNFFTAVNQNANLELDVVSVFTNFSLSQKATGLLRVDHMLEPNPDMTDNSYLPFSVEAEPTLIIAGIDIELDENIHLIPNIETIVYGENAAGETPTADILPRLTLFFVF